MIESLSTIYNGSATIIKNKEYFSSKDYIEPFVEKLSNYTTNFSCLVKPAEQISYDEKSINYTYNRVLINGIFPSEYSIKLNRNDKLIEYNRVVSMTYALDVKNPICKFYTGVIDSENNYYAFGGNCISIQNIEPETTLNYIPIDTIIKNGLKDNCEIILNQNLTRGIEKSKMTEVLGEWIDFCIKKEYVNDSGRIKLTNNLPIEVYKDLMINKDSNYYTDGTFILYPELLQSFLNQITKDSKDIVNRYEKTQLINQMLNL